MIYEFLYKDKPVDLFVSIIPFIIFLIFLGFFIYFYHVAHPPKQEPLKSTTYRYDPELHKHVAISTSIAKYSPEPPSRDIMAGLALSFLLSILFGITTLGASAIYVYDHVTTPSENTKTTDLYRITKENNYLTFTSKKPYNHLYRTKTMEITYTSNGDYVIVTDHQAYKIPKESVSE